MTAGCWRRSRRSSRTGCTASSPASRCTWRRTSVRCRLRRGADLEAGDGARCARSPRWPRARARTAGVNVRQPLAPDGLRAAAARGPVASTRAALVPLLAAELNVKSVELATSADALVSLEAKPNFRALGQRFGKDDAARRRRRWPRSSTDMLRASSAASRSIIGVDGTHHRLTADDVTIHRRASGRRWWCRRTARVFAAIDTTRDTGAARRGYCTGNREPRAAAAEGRGARGERPDPAVGRRAPTRAAVARAAPAVDRRRSARPRDDRLSRDALSAIHRPSPSSSTA